MNKSYKIEGIIIKRINIQEADKIVTIFTKTQGKIAVRAPGIRKIHSRKAPHLELFNQIIGFIHVGKNLNIITEASTLHTFSNLRRDLNILAHAYRMVEEIDRLCLEGEVHRNIYELLKETLFQLDGKILPVEEITEFFLLHLLWDLGFLPYEKRLTREALDNFLEQIRERKLKSNSLLTKIG